MARLERQVAVSFIFMLLIVTIVPVYGLSEEEAEEFYQKFKEAVESFEIVPFHKVPEETVKAMNSEGKEIYKEITSTPEFIEKFKSVYYKTNGFTEHLEIWGGLFKDFNIKYIDRVLETTEIPEMREMYQIMKEEIPFKTNEVLSTFHYWEPKTGAEVMAELEATTTTTNNTEVVRAGASKLEEQLKLAQEKLEAAGVNGEFGLGLSREVPETKTEIEIDYKEVHKEIAELKILLKEIENKIYLLELELLS